MQVCVYKFAILPWEVQQQGRCDRFYAWKTRVIGFSSSSILLNSLQPIRIPSLLLQRIFHWTQVVSYTFHVKKEEGRLVVY